MATSHKQRFACSRVIYNHMAQGGSAEPQGLWTALEELPNTVSKMKSMKEHVEAPLLRCFQKEPEAVIQRIRAMGDPAPINSLPLLKRAGEMRQNFINDQE